MSVSVIIPVYNCEPYIEKCIRSVCAQTYKGLEIIVINDGSTDNSSNIINSIKDDRIKVIEQINKGVCAARNAGIEIATGEYITFIDGDDYVEPDYIEIMLNKALANNSELVISGLISENADGSNKIPTIPRSYERNKNEMWAYRISSTCSRLYNRLAWEKHGLRYTAQTDVKGEDVPICLTANYLFKNITIVDYAGYHYVQHEGSATTQMMGLKKYSFPYNAMDDLAEMISRGEEHNSNMFFDVGVLKFFAHYYYYYGFNAPRDTKREMAAYFKRYILSNCPDYKESWDYVKKHSDLPIAVRTAINMFIMTKL